MDLLVPQICFDYFRFKAYSGQPNVQRLGPSKARVRQNLHWDNPLLELMLGRTNDSVWLYFPDAFQLIIHSCLAVSYSKLCTLVWRQCICCVIDYRSISPSEQGLCGPKICQKRSSYQDQRQLNFRNRCVYRHWLNRCLDKSCLSPTLF